MQNTPVLGKERDGNASVAPLRGPSTSDAAGNDHHPLLVISILFLLLCTAVILVTADPDPRDRTGDSLPAHTERQRTQLD